MEASPMDADYSSSLPFAKWRSDTSRHFQHFLDRSTPHPVGRWLGTLAIASVYALRCYLIQGFYIVSYGLGIYLLNLLIGFLSPVVDPEMEGLDGASLPTRGSDEFKPFIRRLPEFKFWYSITKAFCVAFVMTFFSVFDVPSEPPAEEAALPPPPTATAFQNGSSDYNINTALKSQNITNNGGQGARSPFPSEPSAGIPPIPPSQNQFSARARMGVRSRYVDTFNKGSSGSSGGSFTNSFKSPSTPSVKPAVSAKFFVPTAPVPSDAQKVDTSGEPAQEATGEPSTSVAEETSFSPPLASSPPQPPPSSLQRFPSMDNICPLGNEESRVGAGSANGSMTHSRAASWSGTFAGTPNFKMAGLGGSPPPVLHHNPPARSNSSSSLQLNGGPLVDELDEVEL